MKPVTPRLLRLSSGRSQRSERQNPFRTLERPEKKAASRHSTKFPNMTLHMHIIVDVSMRACEILFAAKGAETGLLAARINA